MIKGGFQGLDISGVDLTAQSPTLPGAYAACQAAAGKTVLVLTAAGAVQCSVKKVSTNYVLAGITGDGKILSITIGSTDGISVSETEIPSAEEPDYIMDYGNRVDLSNYNSESNMYKAPSDGYVWLVLGNLNNTSADSIMCMIRSKNGNSYSITTFAARYDTAGDTRLGLFVKKGFEMYKASTGSGTGTRTINFYPLAQS